MPQLPADRPRYLMGVGKPADIVGAVRRGIDMFDCVMPTRSGRTGAGLHPPRHRQPAQCAPCQDDQPAARRGLPLPGLPPLFARLSASSDAQRRDARADAADLAQSDLLSGPDGRAARRHRGRARSMLSQLHSKPSRTAATSRPLPARRFDMAKRSLKRPDAARRQDRAAGVARAGRAGVVANPHRGSDYLVRFTAPEFTSLCPMTGQPDFAHLVIDYVPDDWLVESKSLKLFLALVPQPRRLPRGLHGGDRQAADRRSSSRTGCASAATGIRAAACRSTCSSRPGRRRRTSGCPTRACPAIAGGDEGAADSGSDQGGDRRARAWRSASTPSALPRPRPRRASANCWASICATAGMATWAGWRDRGRARGDPQVLWPEVRTVVALGLNYGPQTDPLQILAQQGSRGDLRLCPRPRLPRRAQEAAEGAGRAGSIASFGSRAEGVRRYRAGDGEAAGAARRARLAGQAHQPGLARVRLVAVPGRDLYCRSSCRPMRPRSTIAAPASAASTSARPPPSPRPTSSMRGAASPT